MKETIFFKQIEKYCLSALRSNDYLSNEIDQYINDYKLIYEQNVDKEKVKILFLICESLLNYKDKEEIDNIIRESHLSERLKKFLSKHLDKSFNKIFTKSEKINTISLKIICNIFEFLLNEFEIDTIEQNLFQFELRDEKEKVKVMIFKYTIELMKVFVNHKQKDNNNEKYSLLIDDFLINLVNYLQKQNNIDDNIKLKDEIYSYIHKNLIKDAIPVPKELTSPPRKIELESGLKSSKKRKRNERVELKQGVKRTRNENDETLTRLKQ